jgi:hypothetical protein
MWRKQRAAFQREREKILSTGNILQQLLRNRANIEKHRKREFQTEPISVRKRNIGYLWHARGNRGERINEGFWHNENICEKLQYNRIRETNSNYEIQTAYLRYLRGGIHMRSD